MPRIDNLDPVTWKSIVSKSNHAAMRKRHKYPCYEEDFLAECCAFTHVACESSCFCQSVGCSGAWVLRADLDFDVFLQHFSRLWVRGSRAFVETVKNPSLKVPPRWANGIHLLRELQKQWCNWNQSGQTLPSVVARIKRCYFCDDSFAQITPIVRGIRELVADATGVYTSKLVSQLFYDVAVPFDTASAKRQKECGYDPVSYGDGQMREQAKCWLSRHGKSVDDFRALDDAPATCWPLGGTHAPCTRVLDKLFY